jgi:small conductance mechanosensitive channel
MNIDLHAISQTVFAALTAVGLKFLGAIVLFFVGRALIRFATSIVVKVLQRQKIDHTLISYAGTSLTVLLNIILVVALLGFFGIETTSFAALLAGAGLAIGAAWSGLLANFAAGIFLIVLRPFKVGDHVRVGGNEGTIDVIGLFTTTIKTPDNILLHVSNNKVLADDIRNYTASPYRRVELEGEIANSVDPQQARELLLAALAKIPNVLETPAPQVEILRFTGSGTVLAVRPFCHDKNYWQVYFATNQAIHKVFSEAGYPAAPQFHVVKMSA